MIHSERRKSASCPTDRLVTGPSVGRSGELQKWKGSFKGSSLLLLNGINRQEGGSAANTHLSLYFKFQVRCHCSGSIDEVVAPNEASKDSKVLFPTAPEVSGTFQPVNSCQFGERGRDHRVSQSWREASKPKRSICRLLWESSGTTSTYALIWYLMTGKYRVYWDSISIKYEI